MISALPEDSDAELMLRFQKGDEAAFEALVEKFKNPIYTFVIRQVGQCSEAEDIAHNVFIQVYKSAPRYEANAKFTTWLFTIARNLCLNEFRRRGRHPLQSLDEELDPDGEIRDLQHIDPSARSPLVELSEKELHARVMQAIERLPENQRTAVLLCRFEALSYEEIAKVLGASVSATKSLLHRARETLKEELGEFLRET